MAYRQLPSASPAIGFELSTPAEVELVPAAAGVKCREQRAGKTVGELEIEVFKAALVIDRDGILEQKVTDVANDCAQTGAEVHAPVPVEMPGASGFRAEVELHARTALPYIYVFAVAPEDLGVDGGLLVTVRCASPAWEAADAMLASLKILTKRKLSANDAAPLSLPLVTSAGRRDS